MSNSRQMWGHHGKEELMKDCTGTGWHFPKTIRRPRVAHFCGCKSFLFDRHAYSRPFSIDRLEHHRRYHGEVRAWFAVLNEERRVLTDELRRRLQRAVSRAV